MPNVELLAATHSLRRITSLAHALDAYFRVPDVEEDGEVTSFTPDANYMKVIPKSDELEPLVELQTLCEEEYFLNKLGKDQSTSPADIDLSKIVTKTITTGLSSEGRVIRVTEAHFILDQDELAAANKIGLEAAETYIQNVLSTQMPFTVVHTDFTATDLDAALFSMQKSGSIQVGEKVTEFQDVPHTISLLETEPLMDSRTKELSYIYEKLSNELLETLVDVQDGVFYTENGELVPAEDFEEEFSGYVSLANVILDAVADTIYVLDLLQENNVAKLSFSYSVQGENGEIIINGVTFSGTQAKIIDDNSAVIASFSGTFNPTFLYNWLCEHYPEAVNRNHDTLVVWPDTVTQQCQMLMYLLEECQDLDVTVFSELCEEICRTGQVDEAYKEVVYEEVTGMNLGSSKPLVDYFYQNPVGSYKETRPLLPEVILLLSRLLMIPTFRDDAKSSAAGQPH